MEILKKPILTEKMTALGESRNQYAFMVSKEANKLEIRKAVQDMYGVTVENVNTMIVASKARNRFTKKGYIEGRKPAYKKAVVTLAKGEVIDFYSGV